MSKANSLLTSRREFMAKSMYAAVGVALSTRTNATFGAESEEFDYIVIGAGSSGCVVANRLSASGDKSVLLLEAGGPDSGDERLLDFGRFPELQKTKFDWSYQTENEPHLHNRRIDWPRGKVLGGSSTLNAMIYIRGHRLDYDHWSYLGNNGWSYSEVLPFFKRSERNETFHDEFHGKHGLLNVAESPLRNGLRDAFLHAVEDYGLKSNERWDFNGKVQEGVAGFYQHTVLGGERHSTARAFLTPILKERTNLQARTWSFATRILVSKQRAIGVEYATMDGTLRTARAHETVLCAGAIDSPQLLMLSGIGPANHLRSHGIELQVESPGVGKNLIDHPAVWDKYKTNIASHGTVPCGGLFLRSEHAAAASSPDLQFHPYGFVDEDGTPSFGFTPTLVRPHSVGDIRLASPDPRAAPQIRANYLHSQRDIEVLTEGINISREFAKTDAFKSSLGEEVGLLSKASTRSEIEDAIRASATTLYHPVGTCKMGHDADAVVDPALRVRGMEGLRVADASVMPTVVNGNTNAACIMIGEKAAKLILDG